MIAIELVVSLAAILSAALLFTYAIGIPGERPNLGHGAVGTPPGLARLRVVPLARLVKRPDDAARSSRSGGRISGEED